MEPRKWRIMQPRYSAPACRMRVRRRHVELSHAFIWMGRLCVPLKDEESSLPSS